MKHTEINLNPMSKFQVLMVALCFILNFNDGIDVLLVSFSSTDIIKEYGLSKVEMGYIFSAGLAGMTLGCFLIAPFADKIGRRKVFLISTALITLGMYGVWLSNSYFLVLLFRFNTGLGIGGILPTMAATASEFSNKKYRDFNVGLVQAGWPIGAIITGMFCAKYLPIFGWQQAFLIAGIISSLMFMMVFFFMTDSLDYLINQPKTNALFKINALLKKMNAETISELPQKNVLIEKPGLSTILNPTYKKITIRIWIAAFFGFLTLYTLMSWVPNIAKDSGLPFELATWVGIMLNIGAACGSASIGFMGSKFGLRQMQLSYMGIAFLVMLAYAFSSLTTGLIFTLVLFIGFFVQGGFNGIWPILARLYPSKIRATGVGFTMGFGRVGAILGPLLFGYLADNGLSIQNLFIIFSIPLLIMGTCIWNIKSENL
jgi:MFS transporter, AAHS family, 4-hydroxybenzoate transporter